MYRRRKLAIASVILLLVMSAVVATVQATGTTRIPFKATLDLLPWRQISLDGAWFSGEPPIHQVRGLVVEATPSGYPLEGCYITIELNWSINRNRLTNATYSEGEHWGRIAAVDLAGDGGWDISFSGSFVDALGSGKFVGHGWGIYKGLHIKGTYLETSPSSESLVFSGYVTNPGGS